MVQRSLHKRIIFGRTALDSLEHQVYSPLSGEDTLRDQLAGFSWNTTFNAVVDLPKKPNRYCETAWYMLTYKLLIS